MTEARGVFNRLPLSVRARSKSGNHSLLRENPRFQFENHRFQVNSPLR